MMLLTYFFCWALLLVALMNGWALASTSATLPDRIFYYVTVRDFFGASCTSANSGGDTCPNDAGIQTLIAENVHSGHPDFQRVYSGPPASGVVGTYRGPFSRPGGPNFPLVPNTTGTLRPYVLSTLEFGSTGIAKMRYCRGEEGYRCDFNQTSRSVFNNVSFSSWYEDNPRFNRRMAYQQPLFLDSATNQYDYNPKGVKSQDPNGDGFYDPITENNLPGWPRSAVETGRGTKFWFTTEIHTTFQYLGGERFTFAGDDDVHVFINGRLAINLAGVHGSTTVGINLDNFKTELGLEVGKVYDFDLFHAERQTVDSNYRLTTTLAEICNVVNSGFRTQGRDVQQAIEWTASGRTNNSDWFILNGPGFGFFLGGGSQKAFQLMAAGVPNVVSYLFHSTRHNVGSGFSLSFKFRMSAGASLGHGFAVLIHDREQGLRDMNGGTGPNLGITNIENSVALLFDMCPEYPAPCTGRQQLRLHYNLAGSRRNSPSDFTKRTFDDNVVQDWKDNQDHLVEIFYYETPDRMEVYIDRSLRLVERGFNLAEALGGNDANVGFASSSSDLNGMNVRITDVVMTTIKVVDRFTAFKEDLATFPKTFVANGRDKLEFKLSTNDACRKQIQFGGLSNRVQGRLVGRIGGQDNSTSGNDTTGSPTNARLRRVLQSNNGTNDGGNSTITILGDVVDENNGEYSVQFRTEIVTDFSIHLAFGTNCTWNGTAFTSNENCFAVNVPQAAISIPFSTPAPTTAVIPQSLDSSAITGIGVSAGVIFAVGSFLIVLGARMRNQWRREKKFIEAGKLAAMEKDMSYVGDTELDALQNKLQHTIHELQKERAKRAKVNDQQDLIDQLLRQKGELQEMVRRMKIRKMGGDPNSPEFSEIDRSLGSRVRKSFAANRVSNRFSFQSPGGGRLSRGISVNLAALGIGPSETRQSQRDSVSNPLSNPLTRFRSSVSRGFSRMYSADDGGARSSASVDVLGTTPPNDTPLVSSNPLFAKQLANKPKPPPPPTGGNLKQFRIDEEI